MYSDIVNWSASKELKKFPISQFFPLGNFWTNFAPPLPPWPTYIKFPPDKGVKSLIYLIPPIIAVLKEFEIGCVTLKLKEKTAFVSLCYITFEQCPKMALVTYDVIITSWIKTFPKFWNHHVWIYIFTSLKLHEMSMWFNVYQNFKMFKSWISC